MAIAIRKENEAKAVEDKKRYVANYLLTLLTKYFASVSCRKAFMDSLLNNNRPQEEYFAQFNSTSR